MMKSLTSEAPEAYRCYFCQKWGKVLFLQKGTGMPVEYNDYQVPFRFGGKLTKPTVKVEPRKQTSAPLKIQDSRNL